MIYFSIIVPIYKVEEYLQECLESIKNQTYKEFEAILVDDGSPDRSPLICDEYEKNDRRFSVVHKRNEGLVRARKAGIAKAKGKYIIFVDGDDWIDEQMLEQLYLVLEKDSVDIVALGFWQEFGHKTLEFFNAIESGKYGKTRLESQVYPYMLCTGVTKKGLECGIFPSVWSKVFRREIIENIVERIDDKITMGEDAACTYPCLFHADSLIVWNEKFYHYRYVASSMSQKYDKGYFDKVGYLFEYFDKISHLNWGSQLQKYKMFLFLLGVKQKLMDKERFNITCRELGMLCADERFHSLLFGFPMEFADFESRQLIKRLKKGKYFQVCLYYRLKRECNIIEHKLKKCFLRVRGILYG